MSEASVPQQIFGCGCLLIIVAGALCFYFIPSPWPIIGWLASIGFCVLGFASFADDESDGKNLGAFILVTDALATLILSFIYARSIFWWILGGIVAFICIAVVISIIVSIIKAAQNQRKKAKARKAAEAAKAAEEARALAAAKAAAEAKAIAEVKATEEAKAAAAAKAEEEAKAAAEAKALQQLIADNPLLKRMQDEAEERQQPPHPLLAKEMTESAKSAYLSGAVLAALLDDGQIDDAEKRAIRLLGLSLKMSESEISDTIASVTALQTEEAQFSFLQEVIGEIGEHESALFFYCDITKVFGAGGKFNKKAKAFLGAIGGMLKLSVHELKFLDLYIPFMIKDKQRDAMPELTAFIMGNSKFTFSKAVLEYFTPGMDVFSNSSVIFHANDVDLELVKIEPGTFLMGSPDDELGRSSDEDQHSVTLTKGFAIGKYPVTQAQYQAVMGSNPSSFKGNQRPVETVSWDEAMAFCRKLNELTANSRPAGYAFTLPTEAQWEYACRAGSTTALNNNSNLTTKDGRDPNLDGVAWYDKNSGSQTHDVGGKVPNAWGLYDMHGNVWEWCLDWYDDYPTHAVTDPVGAASGSDRVVRGGSWNVNAQYCRSAVRYNFTPGFRNRNLGFRLVLASV